MHRARVVQNAVAGHVQHAVVRRFRLEALLGRDVSLQVFVTRAMDDDIAMANRMRVDVLIRYELAALLRQMAGQ